MARNSKTSRKVPRREAKDLRSKPPRPTIKWLESPKVSGSSQDFCETNASHLDPIQCDRRKSSNYPDRENDIRPIFSKEESFGLILDKFLAEVKYQLTGKAQEKGYHSTGLNGRQLFDFIHTNGGTGHAIGEIIYKAIRFNKKQNLEDLVKIAAWAFLLYDKHLRT